MAKPPLVLIHGFRGAPLGLEAIADRLRLSGYEVFVPAIPPFAGAEFLNLYGPDHYAEFIKSYLEKNHIHRPILVGHSMGSAIAAATASRYPDLLDPKLILMSPLSTRPPRPIAWISPLAALLPRRLIDYVTTKYLFVPHNSTLFKQTLYLTHLCSADQPPLRREVMKATHFSTHYCIKDFRLKQQVLLLAGAKDRLIQQSDTKKLAEKLHATATFLPDTGHLHNYEQPLETAQAILDFLSPAAIPASDESPRHKSPQTAPASD